MADLPSGDNRDQARVGHRSTPGWVKALGVAALLLLVFFVVSRLLGIEHGPDLHSLGLLPERLAVVGFSTT